MKFLKAYENFILESRNKNIYNLMRPFFKNTPQYVFKEFYYANNGFFKNKFIKLMNKYLGDENFDFFIYDYFSDWINIQWKKEIVEVNFNDFNKNTQDFMSERKMGNLISSKIPNDEKRNELQKLLAIKNYGNNEPVIMIKSDDGYELLEGWHRTMSILNIGSDGTENYKNWKKVKLNAWIGNFT